MYLLLNSILLSLAIVAAEPDAPLSGDSPDAVVVFKCNFDASSDPNFDTWPDGWTRMHGPGYPNYLKIEIQPDKTPAGDQSLRINLDGGGAAVFPPPLEVNPLYSYVLEGSLETNGLKFDHAFLSLAYLDDEGRPIVTFQSEKIVDTQGWKTLRLGPIAPPSRETKLAVIGLNVEPEDNEDLKGTVKFAEIRLIRLPRLELKTNQEYNFFLHPSKVEVNCSASGFVHRSSNVTLSLLDEHGKELAEETLKWDSVANEEIDNKDKKDIESASLKRYSLKWSPPITTPGFYRVRAELRGFDKFIQSRTCSLAVVEPHRTPSGGEFGWSLPNDGRPISTSQLLPLLSQAGINWVKYPLWFVDKNGGSTGFQYLSFGEQLHENSIEMVGMLKDPPDEVREALGQSKPLKAVDIFGGDQKVWFPSLEPVLAQMSAQVRWWQLGKDDDTSFLTISNYPNKLADIKKAMDRAAQESFLGIGWDCLNNMPTENSGENLPLRFLALTSEQPLSAKDLGSYLDANKDSRQKRWVTLKPLPKVSNTIDARAEHLLRMMVAAKLHGADAIFCHDPFDPECGLMNIDGTPGEMFLPWRTSALALNSAKYLGSMPLPYGSHNQLFAKANETIMIVWRNNPADEILYLGENVKQIDLWGRTTTPEKRDSNQVFQIEKMPTFITGINESVATWYMNVGFGQDRIPSTFDKAQENSLCIKNTFPREVTGTATIVAPRGWIVTPNQISMRLAPGVEHSEPISLMLPNITAGGRHKIRIDFDISADKAYKFSVQKYLEVGLGDVYLDVKSRLNDRNELEVEQRFVNDTNQPATFRCELFAPERRRVMTEVISQGRGEKTHVFRLEDGKSLIDKTLWLRATEVDGPRILNYRFTATDEE